VYSAARGYGLTRAVASRDRVTTGAADALNRDFVMTQSSLPLGFRLDLPDGIYAVTVTAADFAYDLGAETVSLEGAVVGTIAAPAGRPVRRTYRVAVADGHLDLLLRGTNGNTVARISGLEVTRVG
jgi:fibronectin type 3 domain-containing protein